MSKKSERKKFRRMFIGSLDYNSTEESLKSHFEKWGEIVDCVVMRDSHTGKSKGFGFITYKRAHMVDDVQAARPHIIDGREVKSKRALLPRDSGKPEAQGTVNKLFVAGVKNDLSEEDLREYFGPYGNIVIVDIVTDKITGMRTGHAFVHFDDYDPVDKVVLRSHYYKGRKLVVKKALSREKMRYLKMKKEMEGFERGRGAGGADRNGYGIGSGYGESYGYGYGGGYGYGAGYVYGAGYGTGGEGWGDSYFAEAGVAVLYPAIEMDPYEVGQATPRDVEDFMVVDMALVDVAVDKMYIN